MAVPRPTPYSAFNFLVGIEGIDETADVGGFSEVSGLNAEVTIAEYRAGNAKVNYVTKVLGINKSGDVTLKRGVMGAQNIYEWLNAARAGDIKAKKASVTIKLLNEQRDEQPVVTWTLKGVTPIKWTGPTLTAKGGGDVAIEELVMSVEYIEQS
ncbi:phage tail protein [Cellvibrio sp. KY-GH-1]|uniref:phage tail protein n=1 Tax=Cellvibrio sp. KY-GH-1 TaxID=2303332 RepID=UPI001248B7D2|nr:phage tail protein [Cellvibrio sp. KY-GH-1]QEY16893.1 phage tail protein [Cellvibrio sp. KY-GH-1]